MLIIHGKYFLVLILSREIRKMKIIRKLLIVIFQTQYLMPFPKMNVHIKTKKRITTA
jgi:hypothetical protein